MNYKFGIHQKKIVLNCVYLMNRIFSWKKNSDFIFLPSPSYIYKMSHCICLIVAYCHKYKNSTHKAWCNSIAVIWLPLVKWSPVRSVLGWRPALRCGCGGRPERRRHPAPYFLTLYSKQPYCHPPSGSERQTHDSRPDSSVSDTVHDVEQQPQRVSAPPYRTAVSVSAVFHVVQAHPYLSPTLVLWFLLWGVGGLCWNVYWDSPSLWSNAKSTASTQFSIRYTVWNKAKSNPTTHNSCSYGLDYWYGFNTAFIN